jgi:hypothetical protein
MLSVLHRGRRFWAGCLAWMSVLSVQGCLLPDDQDSQRNRDSNQGSLVSSETNSSSSIREGSSISISSSGGFSFMVQSSSGPTSSGDKQSSSSVVYTDVPHVTPFEREYGGDVLAFWPYGMQSMAQIDSADRMNYTASYVNYKVTQGASALRMLDSIASAKPLIPSTCRVAFLEYTQGEGVTAPRLDSALLRQGILQPYEVHPSAPAGESCRYSQPIESRRLLFCAPQIRELRPMQKYMDPNWNCNLGSNQKVNYRSY